MITHVRLLAYYMKVHWLSFIHYTKDSFTKNRMLLSLPFVNHFVYVNSLLREAERGALTAQYIFETFFLISQIQRM